jgi:hypothetical protein
MVGCFSTPERSLYIVLLKSQTEQDGRHSEPLAGEESAYLAVGPADSITIHYSLKKHF